MLTIYYTAGVGIETRCLCVREGAADARHQEDHEGDRCEPVKRLRIIAEMSPRSTSKSRLISATDLGEFSRRILSARLAVPQRRAELPLGLGESRREYAEPPRVKHGPAEADAEASQVVDDPWTEHAAARVVAACSNK